MNKVIDPGITDVLLAYRFLKDRVRHTPIEYSHALSEKTGAEVFIKWENQQICNSFKVRGALNRMYHLSEKERERGVVTASSGNHAQGIAMAAADLGVRAVVCVPGVCPETKKEAILRLGQGWVELHVEGHFYDDAENAAHALEGEKGMTYVSSFEDPFIISGAGTLGLEMLMDEPELDLLVVPAGGGGLINGVALAAKSLRPSVEVWGVQSVASQPWVVSWPGGKVLEVSYEDSLADGLTGWIPQSLLDLAKKRISGFLAIGEDDVTRGIAFCHRHHHQVIEGAGAVGVGALLTGHMDVKGRRVGVVISGGNIDEKRLMEVLNRY